VTAPTGARLLARTVELDQIAGFLGELPVRASAILLSGVAGIGKTTLLEWAIDEASSRSWRVLRCRASASETTMSFAALGDLLEPAIDDVLGELPEVQRSALEAALLRAGPGASTPDQRAVSAAALGSLRALARAGPVLIAIDDMPWLDAPSADALRFAVRRLRDEPIGVIATVRLGESGGDLLELMRTFPEARARRLIIGPMSPEDLGRLIRQRLDAEFPHPVTERIHLAVEGNPLFALEVAQELVRTGVPEVGAALPIPADVRDLLKARLSALPKPTRTLLLLMAATARPTEALVAGAAGAEARWDDALPPALDAGIVSIDDDRIRFTHPLLASTVYASATASARRDAHRRLATQVDNDEERARHLALASPTPDSEVAAILDEAAAVAASRGAPQSAAQLSEFALRMTPSSDLEGSIRRTAEAAAHLFDAGDDAGARALLETAIAAAGTGGTRARLLCQLASISWMDMDRVSELCERALGQPGDDPGVDATAHDNLAWVGIYRGDLAAASRHATASLDHGDEDVEPAVRADCLSTFGMVQALRGRPPERWMAEAERLHDIAVRESSGTRSTVFTAAPTCHGLQLLWAGELAAAREVLDRQLHAYEVRGQYIVRDEVLGYLAEVECRAGNYELAQRYAREGYEIDEESGRSSGKGHQLFPTALVAAHLGRVAQARSDAEEGLRLCLDSDSLLDANCHRYVLGFLALSMSDPAAAMRHLEPALDYLDALRSAEPGIIPCVPDAVEALVALGRPDDADRLVDRLEGQGRALDRPWARAVALRCRGLLLAHRRDQQGALDAFERALEEHELVPQPFDRARTMLLKGEVERRAKQKAAARSSLAHAMGVFEQLGSPLWTARARKELERIGGRPPSPTHLTATERQVAELVAEGRTNAEVADLLFMSVHTVRSNLRRIYGKLGARNRNEMTAKLRAVNAADGRHPDQ
jgi:DNA-binding CsgD family transcriptional regulator